MAKTEAAGGTPEKKEGGKKPARKTFKKRGEKRVVHHGLAHIHASFNNTHITLTDVEGNVIAWSSAGGIGFKGSRKGTPFAATQAAINAGNAAKTYGLRSVEVRVKGPGSTKYGVFFGDAHANVYGLDAQDGHQLWTTKVDEHFVARITAAPTFYDGHVYVPVSSSEEFTAATLDYPCCTSRGSVAARIASEVRDRSASVRIPSPPNRERNP